MGRPTRTEGRPYDDATRLANIGLEAIEHIAPNAKVIVAVVTDERCGLGLAGYDDEREAVADLLIHARALVQVHGGDMKIIPMPGRG